jgi:hypothetical protein
MIWYEAPCRPDLARHSFLVNCVLAAASPQPSATYAVGTALVLIPATPIAYLCYENSINVLFSTSSTPRSPWRRARAGLTSKLEQVLFQIHRFLKGTLHSNSSTCRKRRDCMDLLAGGRCILLRIEPHSASTCLLAA